MIQRHDDDACEFVEDRCERCEERFSRKFRKRHEKKCPLYECECPLKCGTVLKRNQWICTSPLGAKINRAI